MHIPVHSGPVHHEQCGGTGVWRYRSVVVHVYDGTEVWRYRSVTVQECGAVAMYAPGMPTTYHVVLTERLDERSDHETDAVAARGKGRHSRAAQHSTLH